MNIRIGNQTALSAAYPLAPFEFALAYGFDAFEWFSDKHRNPDGTCLGWDESDMDAEQRAEIRENGMQSGMRFSVHVPWQANPLHAEGIPLLLRSLEFAADIGAALINLHLYTEQGIGAFVDNLLPVVRQSREKDIAISIENTPITSPADFNALFLALDNIKEDTSHVGMCLDMGHANLYAGTHNNYVGYLDRLDPALPIVHLHAHENWGDRDSHLLLFTGPAGRDERGVQAFLDRIVARDFQGAMVLEQWPQPPELLLETRERLLRMLNLETAVDRPLGL